MMRITQIVWLDLLILSNKTLTKRLQTEMKGMLLREVSNNNYSIVIFEKTGVGTIHLVGTQNFPKN